MFVNCSLLAAHIYTYKCQNLYNWRPIIHTEYDVVSVVLGDGHANVNDCQQNQ